MALSYHYSQYLQFYGKQNKETGQRIEPRFVMKILTSYVTIKKQKDKELFHIYSICVNWCYGLHVQSVIIFDNK